MRRPRFGSCLGAVALAAAAVIPVLASPASAAVTCTTGQFPKTPSAQSGLKVACTVSAGTTINRVEVHDAKNAKWRAGAARNVTVTTAANSATITYASGALTASDVRRPISGGCIAGGAFIKTVTATSATMSQPTSPTGCGATAAKIEHTQSRTLVDAHCTTAAASNLTSASALFVAGDVNKSVSGGPFGQTAKISAFVNATTVTVAPAPTTACSSPDTVTIGAATYSAGVPVLFTPETDTRQLTNTATATGFSCTGSTITASSGFGATDVGLKAVVTGSTTATGKINSVGATTAVMSVPCPAGVTAASGTAVIGEPGGTAPKNSDAMMTLSAQLNLNPSLVSTSDDCAKNTYEGFAVVGGWHNPGNYSTTAVIGATSAPAVSVGQVLFPTSVVAFAGYVSPIRTSGTVEAFPHYEFVFPLLPTSLAVCLTAGAPSNATTLALGWNPTTEASAPFLPTGSGNPAGPAIRALGPQSGGPFTETIVLKNNATVVATITPAGCTIASATATPDFACGDG
jgi:hypothetical protein